MICRSCRAQRHEKCPGGTWCDCQHRTTAREAAKRVLERDRELLERLAR